MLEAEVARVLPGVVAGLVEDRLHAVVVPRRVVDKRRDHSFVHPSAPPGQRTRVLAHVRLRVRAAIGAEREELHHLAAVVLVRGALDVLVAVQPDEHRGVGGDPLQKGAKRAECIRAKKLVLVQHQLLGADAEIGGRKPAVPDQRHPLDERGRRAHHAVEPPEMVMPVHIDRVDWPSRARPPAPEPDQAVRPPGG